MKSFGPLEKLQFPQPEEVLVLCWPSCSIEWSIWVRRGRRRAYHGDPQPVLIHITLRLALRSRLWEILPDVVANSADLLA